MASTAIPKTMKAVVLDKPGGPENLQYKTDIPVPVPQTGEVLVKNDFVGVNYVDMYAFSSLTSSNYLRNYCM